MKKSASFFSDSARQFSVLLICIILRPQHIGDYSWLEGESGLRVGKQNLLLRNKRDFSVTVTALRIFPAHRLMRFCGRRACLGSLKQHEESSILLGYLYVSPQPLSQDFRYALQKTVKTFIFCIDYV